MAFRDNRHRSASDHKSQQSMQTNPLNSLQRSTVYHPYQSTSALSNLPSRSRPSFVSRLKEKTVLRPQSSSATVKLHSYSEDQGDDCASDWILRRSKNHDSHKNDAKAVLGGTRSRGVNSFGQPLGSSYSHHPDHINMLPSRQSPAGNQAISPFKGFQSGPSSSASFQPRWNQPSLQSKMNSFRPKYLESSDNSSLLRPMTSSSSQSRRSRIQPMIPAANIVDSEPSFNTYSMREQMFPIGTRQPRQSQLEDYDDVQQLLDLMDDGNIVDNRDNSVFPLHKRPHPSEYHGFNQGQSRHYLETDETDFNSYGDSSVAFENTMAAFNPYSDTSGRSFRHDMSNMNSNGPCSSFSKPPNSNGYEIQAHEEQMYLDGLNDGLFKTGRDMTGTELDGAGATKQGYDLLVVDHNEHDNTYSLNKSQPCYPNTQVNTRHNEQRSRPQLPASYIPTSEQQNCRQVGELPQRYRSIFKFPVFNYVQSDCFDTVMHTDKNLVVSAPTGAGKTVIMELAIIRMLMAPNGDKAKAVYMAPTKALCKERSQDWRMKFNPLGVDCRELTGDTDQNDIKDVRMANIIVTTPEKWDSMTRKWRDQKALMTCLKLFMVDEVHMLHDRRGATLEAVVSRMKTVEVDRGGSDRASSGIRYIGISATVPNIHDVASWLSVENCPCEMKVFGEEYRPVKLEKHVEGAATKGMNAFMFDNSLNYRLMGIIRKFSPNKPVLIFGSTRKSCENAASHLVNECTMCEKTNHPFVHDSQQKMRLDNAKARIKDKKLKEFVGHGIAFHHAGLDYADRKLVEEMYLGGQLQVICTTSTLAVGVNLPAHLVIIKGTKAYINGQYIEYSELDVMQMLGRAGRPQFDTEGKAFVLTEEENKQKYEDLVNGKEVVESSLHENLIEHLNAEIVLETINSVRSAMNWLKSTFLYVRIKSNPDYYKLQGPNINVKHNLGEKKLEVILLKDLKSLHEHGMIVMENGGDQISPTDVGRSMAKYYIKFQTMVNISKLKPSPLFRDELETLSQAEEFKDMRFQSGDKKFLSENLIKNPLLKYPLKKKTVKTIDEKVFLLLQMTLGSIHIPDDKMNAQIRNDSHHIFQHCNRIARCMVEYFAQKKDISGLRHAINLARCLKAKIWDNSPFLTMQLEKVGQAHSKQFAKAGITTFEKLEELDARKIEYIVNRNPPFGNTVLDAYHRLPKLKLDISQVTFPNRPTEIEVFINIGLKNLDTCAFHDGKRGMLYISFLCETSDMDYIDFRRIPVKQLQSNRGFRLPVKIKHPNQTIRCSVILEDYVGLDIHHEIVPSVDKNKFPRGSFSRPVENHKLQRKTSLFDDDNMSDFDLPTDELAVIDRLTAKAYAKAQNLVIDTDDFSRHSKDIQETSKVIPQTGLVACNHKCANKEICRHKCCKSGIKNKRRLPRGSQSHSTDVDQNLPTFVAVDTKVIKAAAPPKSVSNQMSDPYNDEENELDESDVSLDHDDNDFDYLRAKLNDMPNDDDIDFSFTTSMKRRSKIDVTSRQPRQKNELDLFESEDISFQQYLSSSSPDINRNVNKQGARHTTSLGNGRKPSIQLAISEKSSNQQSEVPSELMALNRLHESTSINNHSGPDIKPLKRTNLSSVTHTDSSRVPRKQRRLNSFHEGTSENEFDYDLPSAEDIFDPKTHNRLSTATGVFTKRSHQAHTPSKFPSFDSGQGGGLTADAEDIEIDVSGFANNRSNFSNIQEYSASVFKSASPQHKLKSGAVSSERDIDTSPASSPSSITPAKALSAKEEMLQFLNQCRTNLLHSMKNQKTTSPDPQAKLQLSLSSSSPELSTKMETTACSFSEHQPEDAESNEFSKKICAPDLFANIFE